MPMSEDKVAARDRALLAIRQADAFVVITLKDEGVDPGILVSRSPDDLRRMGDALIALLSAFMGKES